MPRKVFKNPRQQRDQRRYGSHPPRLAELPYQRGRNALADAKRQYQRYLALADAAILNGDTVEAQNCYQHAEHFFRTMTERDA